MVVAMNHFLLISVALATIVCGAAVGRADDDIDANDIYDILFESNDANPVSANKAHELLKQAQAFYRGRSISSSEQPKLDLINSYVEAGDIRADKCHSGEFKKLNLMYIEGLYKLEDEEHFGVNKLAEMFHDNLHYTNALDYLKYQRRKQVKECVSHLQKRGEEAVAKIQAKVNVALTDTKKDFTDSLYKMVKPLLVSSLKNKDKDARQEYGQLFNKEVGGTCREINKEMEPLVVLYDMVKSESKRSDVSLSDSIANWIDRAKTCRHILDNMEDIIDGSYKVYADDKGSSHSFMGKMLNKCFGRKSCKA